MKYEKLKEYFETYVEKYRPYSQSDVHNALVSYLKNTYFRDSYCVIPSVFKKAYEDQVIDQSMFNHILLSHGLPEEILLNLTITEKKLLIKSFNDYHKYKATIYFLKDISTQLNNEVFVYELYVNRIKGKWCFVPYLIYGGNSLINATNVKVDYPLNYMDIYFRADYYYVTENELEYLYRRNEIVLPIKTNLLLLDFFISYNNSSAYKQLLNTIVLNHYKNDTLTLSFFDNLADNTIDKYCQDFYQNSKNTIIFDNSSIEFKISVSQFIKLYYFVFLKYYETVFNVIPLIQVPVIVESSNFPYLITDIPKIKEAYNQAKNVDDITKFFNQYIRNPFLCYCQTNPEINVYDLENILRSESPIILDKVINYINERIEKNSTLTRLNNYKSILDEMKYSFITYIYNNVNIEHRDYFFDILHSLPIITLKDDQTSFYKILVEYKPFHTQLISNYRIRVISDDKLNLVYPDDDSADIINDIKASIENISETIIDRIHSNYHSEELIISNSHQNINVTRSNTNTLNDDSADIINDIKVSVENISLMTVNKIKYNNHSEQLITTNFNQKLKVIYNNYPIINDNFNIYVS